MTKVPMPGLAGRERVLARHFSGLPTGFSGLPPAGREIAVSLEVMWQNCPILGPLPRPEIELPTCDRIT